ncbi:hypothetical protein [Acinetobacter venetianus]|uniref:hypothetical protein n=1 Tax=Acinetobacter venetianus TaxID=52133 RepID=UPI000778687B|nr:hypothetical protein [Acinetobacter venetianus]KXZ65634.1 hypothetical protein AVENLUH7437_01411 [Acinetobacter venetianus]
MNIGILGAVIVALSSALIGFIIQLILRHTDRNYQAKSFELSIVAEVEAILDIIEKRNYREALESGIFSTALGESLSQNNIYTLEIQIQENYCPIYFNNLDKVSLISAKKVKDVVRFYSLLMSLAQDVKPGGLLNTEPSSEAYSECLKVFDEAIKVGHRIIK